jgi:hypothetical protein
MPNARSPDQPTTAAHPDAGRPGLQPLDSWPAWPAETTTSTLDQRRP